MVSELPNCLAGHICQELNIYCIEAHIIGGNCNFYLKGIIWHTMSRQGSGMFISRRNYVRTGTVYLLKGPMLCQDWYSLFILKGPMLCLDWYSLLGLKGPLC